MRGNLEDHGKNVLRATVYAGRQSDGRRMHGAGARQPFFEECRTALQSFGWRDMDSA
jgi:hypothetical protein